MKIFWKLESFISFVLLQERSVENTAQHHIYIAEYLMVVRSKQLELSH